MNCAAGPLPHVSDHAIARAMERGGARDAAEATAMLSTPAFAAAMRIGARSVKLDHRLRALIAYHAEGATVVTVAPIKRWPTSALRPVALGGPDWGMER